MYYQYFGLQEAPFSIAVNPRYLFMSPRHRDALAHLLYGVGAGGGFILLTGEVGTGKTTINRSFLEQLPDDIDVAMVMNPALDAQELLATVCDELKVSYGEPGLKNLTDALHGFLLENYQRGRKTVLMIDEAQHLSFDVLEQIRLLTNLETHTEKLLQIILIGQPELSQMLARPELRQLNQRITARYELQPLDRQETRAYIQHRLQVAGLAASVQLFPANTLSRIHHYTGGIPRLINVLCDRVLLGAYGQGKLQASIGLVDQAAREVLGVSSEPSPLRHWWWALPLLAAVVLAVGMWPHRQAWFGTDSAEKVTQDVIRQEVAPIVDQKPRPVTEVAKPAVTGPAWRLAEPVLWPVFWSLYSPLALPAQPCADESRQGVACTVLNATSMQTLAGLDRPALIQLTHGEAALLLGVGDAQFYVYHDDQQVRALPHAALQGRWTGRYITLWQPPAGYARTLAEGDESPVVAAVAAQFAQLDQQERPLATSRFTPALTARVKLFQREHGLDDDGVIGVQTLQALNRALAIDPTAARARQLLATRIPAADRSQEN